MSRDHTEATALKLAEKKLMSLGWKWDATQIGTVAALIIKAFDAEMLRKPKKIEDNYE